MKALLFDIGLSRDVFVFVPSRHSKKLIEIKHTQVLELSKSAG